MVAHLHVESLMLVGRNALHEKSRSVVINQRSLLLGVASFDQAWTSE